MSAFAVVRHPDIETLGVIPQGVLESHRANGWIRVSPWASAPSDLHLPEYAESFDDLDAEPVPTKKTKSPAAPEKVKDES